MKVLLTKWFRRFARKEELSERRLSEAIARAERGSIDANLGGGLIKQRVARDAKGKSGGYRTIIAYRGGTRCIFLFGYAKNERDNVSEDELVGYRKLSKLYLGLSEESVETFIIEGELWEIAYEADT